jgi:hypothetical protein
LLFCAALLIIFFCRLAGAETVWPGEKEWLKASPESQGMSSQKLQEAERIAKTPIGHAIVIRNGYEIWRYGDAHGRTEGWWASSARSFTTTLFAMLIHRGVIPGGRDAVDMRVNQLRAEAAQSFKDDVLLKHLLSYTSCSSPAGSAWRYGCNWVAMHSIHTDLTGQTAWDFVNAELRPVLGGVAWKAIEKEGTLRVVGPPADMARWGYLWLRAGRWKEKRLFDEWFVGMATDPIPKPDGSGFANPNEGWQIHTNDGNVVRKESRSRTPITPASSNA